MILVTGGTGYIGSHTIVELLNSGQSVLVFDNLSNSSVESLRRVSLISNVELFILNEGDSVLNLGVTSSRLVFVKGDIHDQDLLRRLFTKFEIEAVIHFAGLKAVGESVEKPLMYYDNNVAGSVALFEVMAESGCKTLVFSSSATVYGDPATVPIKEDFPLSTTNPYGASKLMVENILCDVYASDFEWSIGVLRYFNPVGAHESGLIGEDPNGIPNNLMPYISQVAAGRREKLSVYGGDYPTPDGTGMRDYIHVVDLALGHLKALEALQKKPGLVTVNLGTGRGYSVLEIVEAFQKVSGKKVPHEIVARRKGDVAKCYADARCAELVFGWKAKLGLERMCKDAWRWQSKNPKGYRNGE